MHSAIRAGNLQCGGPTGPASPPTPLPPTPPPAPLRPTPAPTPLPPSSLLPGCYFKQPEASTRGCGGPFLQWERDAWGEANVNSRASEAACLGRKQGHDAYCEVITEWLFVPMPLPKQIPTPVPTIVSESAASRGIGHYTQGPSMYLVGYSDIICPSANNPMGQPADVWCESPLNIDNFNQLKDAEQLQYVQLAICLKCWRSG